METHARDKKTVIDAVLNGFSPVSSPMIYWKSRRRLSPSGRKLEVSENTANKPAEGSSAVAVLSERRKALFEPLQPINNTVNGPRPSAESLLPHPPSPDFESANYPKGWLIGKKRKLVNVDVVQSMRRIAIQEMNRKDREIEGLNEQLDEDSRCLERLQLQLAQERSKRAQVERENAMLQDQVNILISMLQQNDQMGEEDQGPDEP